jgi:branched-chain amino acid transport system substrate-binding protein
MKRWWIVSAAVLAAIALAGAVFVLVPERPKPVTLAAIIPTSGPAAETAAVAKGLQLAAERINEAGGIAGRPVELVVRDTEGDVQKARLMFGKLEQEKQPLAYFSATSAVGRGLAPLAENSSAPLISLIATDPHVAEGRDWVYRFSPSAEEEARTLLRLVDSHENDRLGIAYVNDPSGRSILAAIAKQIPSDISYAPHSFRRDATSFEALARELLDFPAVVLAGFTDQVVRLNQALTEAGYTGHRYASSSATLPEIRGATAGLYVAAPALYNPNNVFASEVRQRYSDRFGEPISHYAANGYDALHIVAGLLREGPVERERLREAFSQGFIYPGVVGEIVVEEGNNSFGFELQPARVSRRWAVEFLP